MVNPLPGKDHHMTRFTCGIALAALIAAPAMAQAQDANAGMQCADFLALDNQTQGTILLQVEAGSGQGGGAAPGADAEGTAETTIGGGAGRDGSPGTQSGQLPDATDGGTGTGAAPTQSPAADGGTQSGAGTGAAGAPATESLLETVVAACRADQTLTVADAVEQARSGQGTAN